MHLPGQGLNFLAATFLLFMPEEEAFWCLCALIEDILGPGYFDEHMVPVQVGLRAGRAASGTAQCLGL